MPRGPEKTFYSDIKVGLKQQPNFTFVMTGLQGLSIRFAYLCVQYVKLAKKDHYSWHLFNLLYCNDN